MDVYTKYEITLSNSELEEAILLWLNNNAELKGGLYQDMRDKFVKELQDHRQHCFVDSQHDNKLECGIAIVFFVIKDTNGDKGND